MRKLAYLIVFGIWSMTVSAQIYRPEGVNIPGAWCQWSNPPSKVVFAGDSQVASGKVHYLTDHDKRYHTTFYIDSVSGADTTAGTYAFLFTSGPTSNYWQNKWGKTAVILDSLQNYTYQGNTDNTVTLSNGSWYTINFEDKGYNNTRGIFMRTSRKPVTIDSLSHPGAYVLKSQPPAIQLFLSDTPSAEEIIYVRYTKDNWATSGLIQASVNGKIASSQMPAFNAGDTIRFYAFTSTQQHITSNYGLYTINYLLNHKEYIVSDKLAAITWISGNVLCPNSSFEVTYQAVTGYNQGNQMTVWMSDSTGSFSNPIAIGTKVTTASQDTISCTVPQGFQSSGYKIMLTSDSPADSSDAYASTFSIKTLPMAVWTYYGPSHICTGDSIRLSIQSGAGYRYQWLKNGNAIAGATDSSFFASDSANYTVVVTNSCGADTATSIKISWFQKPTAQIQTNGVSSFCYGDSLNLIAFKSGGNSIKWLIGNNPITGATDSILTIYNSGTYQIFVADTSTGCFTYSLPVTLTTTNCNIVYSPEGINMPGSWNSWTNAPTNKPVFASSRQVQSGGIALQRIGIRRYTTRFHIDTVQADTSAGKYNFLFTSGPSSNYWQNKWTDIKVIMDSLQRYSFQGGLDNEISVTNGNWYTVHLEDNGYNNTRGIFMETPQKPVTIDSVKQQPTLVFANNAVSVHFELSGKPSAKEFFYVRYTTNYWKASNIIPAVINGVSGSATIPPTNSTDTIFYYIFSSTHPAVARDYDLYTLEMNNNQGSNYSYISRPQYLRIDSISKSSVCSGDSILVSFSSGTMNSGNYFTIELSDSKGSFATPKNLITLRDSLSGNVYVVIPNSQPGGIAYRLRVLSSDPQLISLPNASDITVNESPADSLKINGNTAICSGDSLRMSVKSGTGFTFEWFYNNSKIASDSFIYASAAGKYFAQISAPNGCVAKTKEATISVFNGRPNPVIKNIGNTSFCIGGNVALYVPKVIGETYQWRYNFADIAGATDTSIIATQTGSYEILVTNGCGSVLSAPAVVYSNPLPIVSISGKSNICQGESVNFIAKFDSVYTYQWYKNDTLLTGATNDTLLINTDGTYSVIITNPFGCSDTAVKTLTIDPIPDASISYNGLAQICQGKILNLSANAGFQSYQWYLNGTIINGASQAMYSASQAGDYKVRVITAIGCSATTQNPVKVSVNSLPVKPTITSNGSILTASSANNYQWFVNNNIINGATQKDYNTNYIAGKYAVLISDSNSCEALSDPFEILGISQTARRGQHAIFPNPTTGIIHVSLSGNLKVYDISGKIVVELKEQFNGEERVIDLSEFPAGIYIIQIDSQFHRVNLIK